MGRQALPPCAQRWFVHALDVGLPDAFLKRGMIREQPLRKRGRQRVGMSCEDRFLPLEVCLQLCLPVARCVC